MAEQRRQQTLFQENSTTVVTRLAAELKERLEWSLPETSGEHQKEESLFPLEPDMPGAAPAAAEELLSRPSLPGVRVTHRTLHVVPDSAPPASPAPLRAAPAPSLPVPASPPVLPPAAPARAAGRSRRSESGMRSAAEIEAAAIEPAPSAVAAPPEPPAPPPPRRTSNPVLRAEPQGAQGDPGATSDWSAVWSSSPPPPRPQLTAPTPPVSAAGSSHNSSALSSAPREAKSSSVAWIVAGGAALMALGLAGNQVLQQRQRPAGFVAAAAAPAPSVLPAPAPSAVAAPAPTPPPVRGMVLASGLADSPQPGPSCLRDSAQTISSQERDKLLLSAVQAFDRGKQEQAQELLRRYVEEACDGATLEALGLLNRQLAGSARGGGK
jgi:hypothetical protein